MTVFCVPLCIVRPCYGALPTTSDSRVSRPRGVNSPGPATFAVTGERQVGMETRELPDATDDQVAAWLQSFETMRPDILEGFAENAPQMWSASSIEPVMEALRARLKRYRDEVSYRAKKDAPLPAYVGRRWVPGEVQPDGRIKLLLHYLLPDLTYTADADLLESKAADYGIPRRRR